MHVQFEVVLSRIKFILLGLLGLLGPEKKLLDYYRLFRWTKYGPSNPLDQVKMAERRQNHSHSLHSP